MIIISHRGNLEGPSDQENTGRGIVWSINSGFDVEIDVRLIGRTFFMGHDSPDEVVDRSFMSDQSYTNHIWWHAKDIWTLHALMDIGLHCFFHDSDECTITSKGYIWTYPGRVLTTRSIAVMCDPGGSGAAGVCTDYPTMYNK